MHHFARYYQIGQNRAVMPNFTVMTADKDDPRFDSFYLHANIARLFIAFFLDMPSYMGLGFETRDIHHSPAPNEHYTKLYVFQIAEGPKATFGPYHWGQNIALFQQIQRLKRYVDDFSINLKNVDCEWLIPPNSNGNQQVIVWKFTHITNYFLVVNLGIQAAKDIALPASHFTPLSRFQLDFSTHRITKSEEPICTNLIEKLEAGEGQVFYRIE